MRSPSHGGTRPPWSGRPALPPRRVIESGSSRDHSSSRGGFASTGGSFAGEDAVGGSGDLIEPCPALGTGAIEAFGDLADRQTFLDRGQEIDVILRTPCALCLGHRCFLSQATR